MEYTAGLWMEIKSKFSGGTKMTRQELVKETMQLRNLTEWEANAIINLLEAQHIIAFSSDNQLGCNLQKFSMGY